MVNLPGKRPYPLVVPGRLMNPYRVAGREVNLELVAGTFYLSCPWPRERLRLLRTNTYTPPGSLTVRSSFPPRLSEPLSCLIVMPPRYKQQPTLEGVRIRTEQDALLVFYGVARGILTLLTRRLDADERKAIAPGHVYVWEDRSATTSDSGGLSMERW